MSSPLGRGLSALIPQHGNGEVASGEASAATPVGASQEVLHVPVDKVKSNPAQPRKLFDHAALEDLVSSIRAHGILLPLVVTPAKDGTYQLVAGERRLRAATIAGLKTVPVVVREAGELERLELGLIENVQREDLNPIELAEAYRRLVDDFSLTQEQVAERVGKSRPGVANTLRLLNLPEPIQHALADGKITFGHAKLLLSVVEPTQQRQLFEKIVAEQLSVQAATVSGAPATAVRAHRRRRGQDPAVAELERELQESLGSKVRIRPTGSGGEITLTYFDRAELERLCVRLRGGELLAGEETP